LKQYWTENDGEFLYPNKQCGKKYYFHFISRFR